MFSRVPLLKCFSKTRVVPAEKDELEEKTELHLYELTSKLARSRRKGAMVLQNHWQQEAQSPRCNSLRSDIGQSTRKSQQMQTTRSLGRLEADSLYRVSKEGSKVEEFVWKNYYGIVVLLLAVKFVLPVWAALRMGHS